MQSLERNINVTKTKQRFCLRTKNQIELLRKKYSSQGSAKHQDGVGHADANNGGGGVHGMGVHCGSARGGDGGSGGSGGSVSGSYGETNELHPGAFGSPSCTDPYDLAGGYEMVYEVLLAPGEGLLVTNASASSGGGSPRPRGATGRSPWTT